MAQAAREYRLLIVDDDETDRRLYGWLLARQAPGAFVIEQAVDGAAGIAALRARTFDCVLLDFSLPDLTGLEFLADVMADGELPAAFVLITGHGNEALAVDAMKLGVRDYLVKDHVNEGRLWRAIVRAVSQRELHQHLTESRCALTAAIGGLEQEIASRVAAEGRLLAAMEAAAQADQARTRFAAMVTHELRARLAGVLGQAELLLLEGGLTARQHAMVGEMLRAGEHLSGIVCRVLDFASIEAGRVALASVPLSVHERTEDSINDVVPLADESGLSLHSVWPHGPPRPPESETPVTLAPDETTEAAPSSGRRVPRADDAAVSRDVIGAFLYTAGHEVRIAENRRGGVLLASE